MSQSQELFVEYTAYLGMYNEGTKEFARHRKLGKFSLFDYLRIAYEIERTEESPHVLVKETTIIVDDCECPLCGDSGWQTLTIITQ